MNGIDPQARLTDVLPGSQFIQFIGWTNCSPGIGRRVSDLRSS
jgi:hypothetical protein